MNGHTWPQTTNIHTCSRCGVTRVQNSVGEVYYLVDGKRVELVSDCGAMWKSIKVEEKVWALGDTFNFGGTRGWQVTGINLAYDQTNGTNIKLTARAPGTGLRRAFFGKDSVWLEPPPTEPEPEPAPAPAPEKESSPDPKKALAELSTETDTKRRLTEIVSNLETMADPVQGSTVAKMDEWAGRYGYVKRQVKDVNWLVHTEFKDEHARGWVVVSPVGTYHEEGVPTGPTVVVPACRAVFSRSEENYRNWTSLEYVWVFEGRPEPRMPVAPQNDCDDLDEPGLQMNWYRTSGHPVVRRRGQPGVAGRVLGVEETTISIKGQLDDSEFEEIMSNVRAMRKRKLEERQAEKSK